MAFVHSLCSSSKGNSTYIGDKESGILIDAGIGIRSFNSTLQLAGVSKDAIKAIFITHEHSDHIKGLSAILKNINVPIYASVETLEQLIEKRIVTAYSDLNELKDGEVTVADMNITAFSTPHDSANSQGYCIQTKEGDNLCFCTDLGGITDEIFAKLSRSKLVFLESNYDTAMLTHGDYPYYLKHRIASSRGHLSNEECSKTLARLIECGTTKFILGHLSLNNNRPELAFQAALCELLQCGAKINSDYSLMVAPPNSIGEIITI